jgi:hypothetical protein
LDVRALWLGKVILASRLWFGAVEGSPPEARPAATILFLIPSRPNGLDWRSLADAVAVYTRDLQLTVQAVPDGVEIPQEGTPARLAGLLRARAALLAFWCVPSEDGHEIALYSVDAHAVLRAGAVSAAGLRDPDLHRAVALQLRGFLTPEVSRSAPASSPSGTAPNAPAAAGSPSAVVPATAPQPWRSSALDFAAGLGYAASWTPGATSLHQLLALRAMAALGHRRRAELLAGVDLSSAARGTVASGIVSLRDIPMRVGGRLRWTAARLVTAVGVFGAVHLLFASATSSAGAGADTFTTAGGGGLEALVRGPLWGRLSWEVRGFAEVTVPRTRFLVGGSQAIETGRYATGLGLGLTFPTR